MARVAVAVAASGAPAGLQARLAAVSAPGCGAEAQEWSIDSESADSSWYESSRLLHRGLQVDEDPPRESIPPEWQWRWWLAARAAAQ